ncbi:MAG: EAL domain-containing protein [Alphaproteobacteria bacterium]|nr:EAL domain-containing protein [Alphaproteobacteria bacterium]
MSDRTFRLAPSDIDKAFECNEFRVVFQPKVDLTSERVTGAEVFVRWQHPQYGLLPPGLFLDFVEANGRMPDLTGFVFHAALDGARRWKAAGKDWAVSINVAPGTVTSKGFCEGLQTLLNEYGLEPQRIIIEVPERAVAQEPDTLCEALLEVRELGVHVALDGGGIVPVDLAQFSPLPFTSVKVGGPASIRLAQRLGLRGKGAIAARLRFAHQYNLEAVAVGAEDEATMAGLADVGFTAAQGIWIQKPMPLEELLAWNGAWARGRVSMDPMPAAAQPARAAAPVEAKPQAAPVKRATMVQPTLQPKPEIRAMPTLPVLDVDDLDDIVEDEEAAAPQVKRQGFGPPAESCPPMKELVQRKPGKGAPAGPSVLKN